MTTIATDGISMASDGLVTAEGFITQTDFRKVVKLIDGRIVGGCGSAFDLENFIRWLLKDTEQLTGLWDQSEFLVLETNGRVFCYNHVGNRFETSPATTSRS